MIKHLRDRRLLAILVICILAAPQLVQGAINVARAIGPGAKMDASASAPANCGASATSGCVWLKSGDGFHGSYNGTDTLFGAGGGGGGGSLQADYTAGGAGGGVVGLTSSGGGLRARDNATPLAAGTVLLGAQNIAGTAHYFECTATGCSVGAAAPGALALNVPVLKVFGTTGTNSAIAMFSDANSIGDGTQVFFEDRNAPLNLKRLIISVQDDGSIFFDRGNDNGTTASGDLIAVSPTNAVTYGGSSNTFTTFTKTSATTAVSGQSWITPTLLNSYVAYGAPDDVPGYCKLATGEVRLRGSAHNGTGGTSIFQLPAGYRPLNRKVMPARIDGSVGTLAIDATGDISDPWGGGGNTFVNFDGIAFMAEQ